jgi:glycosyltransferase involved in cell wall biosynthesis
MDGSCAAERPLRVLWVLKAVGWGGAESLLLNTARVIDHDRFDVSCVYIQVEDVEYVQQLTATGVQCIDLSDRRGGLAGRLLALASVVHQGDWDIIHVHSPVPGSIARLATLGRRGPKPVLVTTEHNTWGSFHPMTRSLNAMSLRLDDAVIAVSQETYLGMSDSVRSKARVVTHGVLGDDLRSRAASSETLEDSTSFADVPILVTVANLRANKDHMTLLAAYEQLVRRGVAFHAVLVGDGTNRDALEAEISRLGLSDHVEMLGRRSDAPELVAASDLFVLSSVREGLPVAIMEAFALGIPVVSTAVGGIPDALEGTGAAVLVEPGDPTALAAAIEGVLADDEQRAGMAVAARKAADRFDLALVVADLEQLYCELAAANKDSGA